LVLGKWRVIFLLYEEFDGRISSGKSCLVKIDLCIRLECIQRRMLQKEQELGLFF
jgi:hypothetical protein